MTLTDEQYAHTLRSRVAVAAPPMALDPNETVRLGSRRRRARRWGAGAAATAGVAAIALVAVAVLSGPGASRTPVAQAPRAIGSGQVVELAPGITATNELTTTTSSGETWWDTGLTFEYPGDGAVRTLSVGFAPYDPTDESRRDPGAEDGIAVGVTDVDEWSLAKWGTVPLVWADSPGEVGGFTDGAYTLSGDVVARVVAGAVPTWVNEPRVALYLPAGTPAFGGGTAHWFELPTVADPQGSGRLLVAAVLGSGVTTSDDPRLEPRTIIVAGDGSRSDVSQVCGETLTTTCLDLQPDGGAALRDAITSLGGSLPAGP